MELPDLLVFGGVGTSCPRFLCSYSVPSIFMLPCVLLEGILIVCVAFFYFFSFFLFCMKPPSKKLHMDDHGGLLVHIECCD